MKKIIEHYGPVVPLVKVLEETRREEPDVTEILIKYESGDESKIHLVEHEGEKHWVFSVRWPGHSRWERISGEVKHVQSTHRQS